MMRFIPLVVFLIVAAVMAIALLSGGAPQPPDVMVGRSVPATKIEGIDADQWRRGTVIVNFFASWCAPCADEQPVLAKLSRESGARIIGVAYKDKPQAVKDWLDAHGNPFSLVGYDAQGAAAIDWGVYGVPETYVVIDGVIRHRHVGPLDDATMQRDILPLVLRKERQ